MTKKVIRFVQAQLNERGLDAGPVDGDLGPRTLAALDRVEGLDPIWSKRKKAVGFVQLLAGEHEIEAGPVDGLWGPQTEFAYETLVERLVDEVEPRVWRPESLPVVNPNAWPSQNPESGLIDFYGDVNTRQTRIDLPYPHRLSWDKRTVINRFSCHERVSESLSRILAGVLDHYGLDEIRRLRLDLWGGCLNVRMMRGGDRYSMHSWGIAVDYDPERNRLKWGRDRASFAKPEYDAWWQIWESEGWVSLGRQRNFDWMHVQAARL